MKLAIRSIIIIMMAFSISVSILPSMLSTYAHNNIYSLASSTAVANSKIIGIGNSRYYRDERTGKIRKTAGFIKLDGELYYIQGGGKLATGNFRVGSKKYKAWRNGKVATGVYKGARYYWYSDPKTGEWIEKQGFVKWNGHTYYLNSWGAVVVGRPFVYKNRPYVSNSKGHCRKLSVISEGSPVLSIAQRQIDTMTGRKYWRWYYGTKFRDTDRTPWCGAFVAWCYSQAGKFGKIGKAERYGPLGYVPTYSKYARNYGKWVRKKNAKPGDIIVFGRDRHVGIVECISGKYIFTIEGNSGPTATYGCGKPGAVTRKIYRLDDTDIKGVVHP